MSAIISDCGLFRWRLDREVQPLLGGFIAALVGVRDPKSGMGRCAIPKRYGGFAPLAKNFCYSAIDPCVDGSPLARVFLHCAGWSWRPCVRPMCAALYGRWP